MISYVAIVAIQAEINVHIQDNAERNLFLLPDESQQQNKVFKGNLYKC